MSLSENRCSPGPSIFSSASFQFLRSDRIIFRIVRSEDGPRFACGKHMKTHVALGKQMLPRSEYFLECLLPSPHRLPIYHYNDMSNNRRPYPFVGKGIVNVGCIAAVEFENGPHR